MSQKANVLRILEAKGAKGARSDEFIKMFMPRAAARVQELKDDGYCISSEREGKYVRWTLNVGVEAEQGVLGAPEAGESHHGDCGDEDWHPHITSSRNLSLDSGVADLNVGSSTEGSTRPRTEGLVELGSLSGKTPGVASGVERSDSSPSTGAPPANPYMYELWAA